MVSSFNVKFRRILSQIIASSSKNCILLTVGVIVGLPAVIIPSLVNDRDEIHLSYEEASWFASGKSITMLVGNLLSGYISASLGRKRAMLICVIPHLTGIWLLYFATNSMTIFIAIAMLGLGTGLGESAIATYVGEICEPSIRGALLAFSSCMFQTGLLLTFLLGSLLAWRQVVLITSAFPCLAFIITTIAPEVPSWLILKNRNLDAQKSLQWLRGWVSFDTIENEFQQIENHVHSISKCDSCRMMDQQCDHLRKGNDGVFNGVRKLFERQNSSALFIIMTLWSINYLKCGSAMIPFIVQILTAYGAPIDAKWATVIIGVASLLGRIATVPAVKLFGKRICALYSILFVIAGLVSLGLYGAIQLPYHWTSFQKDANLHVDSSYIPLILFAMVYFFSGHGIDGLPCILTGEILPLRNRSACTCIVLIFAQILQFATLKSYIYLDMGWGLSGAMWFFSSVAILGLLFIYFCVPETEGVTIEDIEEFFYDRKRKITDVHIKKYLERKRQHLQNFHSAHKYVPHE